MSFFNTTYSQKRSAEQTFDIPFKNQCTEESKNYLSQGTRTFSDKYYTDLQESTELLFASKIQVLVAYMTTDPEILEKRLTEKDIFFIANIMISTDSKNKTYREQITKAKSELPGYIDCQLSEKIYKAIAILKIISPANPH